MCVRAMRARYLRRSLRFKGWSLPGGGSVRAFRHGPESKWGIVRREIKQIYRKNAYRVLLTRARQGIVIYVPAGDALDPTRNPAELDGTAEYLLECGVISLDRSATEDQFQGADLSTAGLRETLF